MISSWFFLLFSTTHAQLISPCPRLFNYEPQGAEKDRSYGSVTFFTDTELPGVWLRLIFDKPSILLGNWFGEVETEDNQEYLIKNINHKLIANKQYNIRFFIKYNRSETPPQLTTIRLNARTICPEDGAVADLLPPTKHLLETSILPSVNLTPSSNAGSGSGSRPSNILGFSDNTHFKQNNTTPSIRQDDVACGTVVVPPRPLITYSQATHEGEFPWHAALYHSEGFKLTYTCSASLVTRYHLLTAAHCVTITRKSQALDPATLIIYLGKYYLNRFPNSGIQSKAVDTIIVHPQYNPDNLTNDIAVLKIRTPVEITNYVRPVCLWEENTDLQPIISKSGIVVGWGFDENGKPIKHLTKAQMPIVAKETCIYSYPEFYSKFSSDESFCAGFRNGTSVCTGNSGGGMVFPKTQSNAQNPVWQLRGLVSINVVFDYQFICDSSHYLVFTDVAKYLNWIRASLM